MCCNIPTGAGRVGGKIPGRVSANSPGASWRSALFFFKKLKSSSASCLVLASDTPAVMIVVRALKFKVQLVETKLLRFYSILEILKIFQLVSLSNVFSSVLLRSRSVVLNSFCLWPPCQVRKYLCLPTSKKIFKTTNQI